MDLPSLSDDAIHAIGPAATRPMRLVWAGNLRFQHGPTFSVKSGMPSANQRPDKRKSHCPKCDCRADAKAVTYGNDIKTLTYECPTCGHKWDVKGPAPEKVT